MRQVCVYYLTQCPQPAYTFAMHTALICHIILGRYPKLIFHFQLRRSILYFILETYVPSSALVVLSWVSFWISQSSVPARICIGMDREILSVIDLIWLKVYSYAILLQYISFQFMIVYIF